MTTPTKEVRTPGDEAREARISDATLELLIKHHSMASFGGGDIYGPRILLALRELQERRSGWRPISTAPKDGTTIWAAFRPDIYPTFAPDREDLQRWHGVQVPLRHEGGTPSGHDLGWSIAAPVGHGGFPDGWIAGWRPLPGTRGVEEGKVRAHSEPVPSSSSTSTPDTGTQKETPNG